MTVHIAPMTANQMNSNKHRNVETACSGVTLIEVLVVLSIAAILAGIALPSFQRLITSTRLTGQINELVADLSTARSEAGARSRVVSICNAGSPTACNNSGNWQNGWIIWADNNSNGALDAATEIIKYTPPLSGNVTMALSGFSSNNSVTFLPYGGLSPTIGGPGAFTLCASGDTTGRQITIPFTGRALAKRIYTCP